MHAIVGELPDGSLPPTGIFYIKGGSQNRFGWKPANPDPYVQANYLGDDDHPGPGDTDAQIGETFVATSSTRSPEANIGTIRLSSSRGTIPEDSTTTYHVPPPQVGRCPDGAPCGDGPRLPFILISPYARSGAVVHDAGDQTSVLQFVERLFEVPPLAVLPDEKAYLPEGPRDADPAITDMLGAFDPARVAGTQAPIPASEAQIPDVVVNTMPEARNCRSLGIVPVTLPDAASPPPNFALRPSPAPRWP